MNISPLPKDAIKDGVKTPVFYDWYEENEEAIYRIFEESFAEWFEEYIANIANVEDIAFGGKN